MVKPQKLIAKLERVLADAFPGAEVRLERTKPSQKVDGFLIWKGFLGREQIKRQERMWRVLQRQLSQEEQLQITVILTATPEEMTVVTGN